jgi:hypothetical protein
MQNVALRASVIRQIIQSQYELDSHLPKWARRSHPIVRRHLGVYWRVMTPQVEPVAQWYIVQALAILLTYPLPFLFTVILPMVIVSGALLPAGLFYYVRVLYEVGSDASRSMLGEVENATLPLLIATPYPLREILLSKIAGSIWKQSESLSLLISGIVMSQMPTIVLVYLNRFPPDEYGLISQLFMVVVFAASVIRVPLEIFMTATIAHAVGVSTTGRSTAIATTLVLLGFYFVLINMPRLITMSVLPQLFVDAFLPVIVPPLITLGALWYTEREIGNKL